MRVYWTDAAASDLERIEATIKLDNPVAAVETVLDILDTVEKNLPEHPGMGRPGRVGGTRELVVADSAYIVAYEVEAEHVTILRVLHGARRWPDAF